MSKKYTSMPIMSPSGAMQSIVDLLDGKEWDSEDLETVAEFCRLAGYDIRPPMTWHNCPNCGGHREDEAT